MIEVEDTCEGTITFEDDRRANFYTTAHEGRDAITICLKTQNHTVEIRPLL